MTVGCLDRCLVMNISSVQSMSANNRRVLYRMGMSALTGNEKISSMLTRFSLRTWHESRNKCGVAARTDSWSFLANPPSTYASGRNSPITVPSTTYTWNSRLPLNTCSSDSQIRIW